MTTKMRNYSILALLAVAMLVGVFLSLTVGAKQSITTFTVWQSLFHYTDSLNHDIIWSIRWPRALIALVIGSNLALAGMILQAITRNSLASPALLGINQGASLAMALGLVYPVLKIFGDQGLALCGAALGGFLTFVFAGGLKGTLSPVRLVLSGIAVSAFAIALVRFTFLLEDNLARQMIQWTAGDISGLRWSALQTVFIWSAVATAGVLFLSHRLNLLSLGEGACRGLGVNPHRVQLLGSAIAAVLTGVSVSVAGPIMFIGLVIPHVARFVFGTDHRILTPACMLIGATFLCLTDISARLLHFPYETPVGVICALIGAPYFIYLTMASKEMA